MRKRASWILRWAFPMFIGNLWADGVFPLEIAALVDEPRPASTVQVLLERDDSRRWQQYLDFTPVKEDGRFKVTVQRPGTYWLLATEETRWSTRRGACVVKVEETGAFSLRPVPNLPIGKKWGGARGTAICREGKVPLGVYRKKPAPARKLASRRVGATLKK